MDTQSERAGDRNILRNIPPNFLLGKVLLGYLALAVALTWPTVTTLTSRLGGDFGDGFQNLWNFWWLKESVLKFHNPFFTDHLRAPFGVTLVFQTFCLPDAVVALPFWAFLPPVGVYNIVLLWSFVLTGWGMYALVRDWTDSWPAAFFAGAVFMACPFHMAHALGHQHLVELGYLPLYLMFLHRLIRGGSTRDAVLGGLALAAAALCSWYQLIFATGWSLGVFVYAAIAHRKIVLRATFAKQAFTLAAAFLGLTLPLMLAMYRIAHVENIVGAHDALSLSADLKSFFYPGARSAWYRGGDPSWLSWTGNAAENGNYLGYALMALGVFALSSSGLGRTYAVTGYVGAALSLGPALHVGGHLSRMGAMPYAKLVRLLPVLDFSGVPVRFGLMAQGSVVILAGLGLAALLKRVSTRWVLPLAGAATVVGLLEFLPRPLPTSVWTVPPPMAAWAKEKEDFTVLDLSDPTRMLWHAIHHRHRCVGGYVTRVPARLEDWWFDHPVFGGSGKRPLHPVRRLARDDAAIDFDWKAGSPDPSIFVDLFQAGWDGTFEVTSPGDHVFSVKSDDGVTVRVDGRIVIDLDTDGERRSEPMALSVGRHDVRVDYQERFGTAEVHLYWEGPTLSGQPSGQLSGQPSRQLLRPAAGRAGEPAAFHGVYSDAPLEPSVPREEALKLLRAIKVRYVVVNAAGRMRTAMWGGVLALPLLWEGDGLLIYEVPAEAPVAAPAQPPVQGRPGDHGAVP